MLYISNCNQKHFQPMQMQTFGEWNHLQQMQYNNIYLF